MIPVSAPTACDLFLAVAALGPCSRDDLCRSLLLARPDVLQEELDRAVEERLVLRRAEGYRKAANARARALFQGLTTALSFGIDYNRYFAPEVQEFLKAARGCSAFAPGEEVSPQVLLLLMHHGLVLVYSYEPLVLRLVENPFLEGLAEFLGLSPGSARSGEPPRRNFSPVTLAPPLLVSWVRRSPRRPAGLSVYQQIIRHDLLRLEEGPLDAPSRRRQQACLRRMRERVAAGAPLSRERILEYHRLLMGDGGNLRTIHVQVANNPYFRTADPEEVGPLLDRLVARCRHPRPGDPEATLRLAAWLYNEFLYIHPFEDGNTRTARMLVAHLFRESRLPVEEIPSPFELRFLQASKGARERRDDRLEELFREVLVHSLNRAELHLARLEAARSGGPGGGNLRGSIATEGSAG